MSVPATFIIREASSSDTAALLRLAALDSAPALRGRVLLGEINGVPAAALSLADGRVVADPFRPSAHLIAHLRLRARAVGVAARPLPPKRARARTRIRIPRRSIAPA